MKVTRLFLVVGFCALTSFRPATAPAYDLFSYFWQVPVVPIRVQMGTPDIALADGSTNWNSVIENALQLWNEQMDRTQLSWTEVSPGTPASFGDGVNSVQFSSTVYGDAFGENVLAVALTDSNGGQTTEADVLFNTANRFNSYRGAYSIFNGVSYLDAHRIALHEFGHVLGLGHPDEVGQTVDAIMNSHVSGLYELQADDTAGVVARYGAPPNAPSPTGNAQIVQISTRGSVGTGDAVMIGGFIIQEATKKIIVRAIGPSLGAFGVAGALQNPVLELHDGTGAVIATNDNWRTTQEEEVSATGLAPSNDLEAAIVADLAPGNYTAIVTGAAGGTGVALVEVYDLAAASGKLGNISTRSRIGAGDDVMIGGFIVSGPQTEKNIIRAVGQSLAAAGVTGAITNPLLELYNSNGDLLQTNDDFSSNRDAGVIRGYGLGLVNGFESGIYFEGGPGNFTAIMRGVNGATGIGLIEVYRVE